MRQRAPLQKISGGKPAWRSFLADDVPDASDFLHPTASRIPNWPFPRLAILAPAGEVAERPQAREEEIRAAADRDELRQTGNALPHIALAGAGEIRDGGTSGHGRAVAKQRIAFV